jgi:predicted DNA-binding transcriptional regulator AlpA
MTTAPRYMSLETLESYVDACETTIEKWMTLDGFPAPRRIGKGGTRRWDREKVDCWMAGERPQDSAADVLGRIRNATREEVLRRDARRGVRQRNQRISSLTQISGSGTEHTEKLPESPVAS